MYVGGYSPLKMKRKDLEEVNEEFSDFSLSSPARKIRRLDAELPPIMEEEEPDVPMVFENPVPQEQVSDNTAQVGGQILEELPSLPVNGERAIVLFKPMDTPLLQSPSHFSVTLNPEIISGFKNQVLRASQHNPVKSSEDGDSGKENKSVASDKCLAVVPWIPSQVPPPPVEGEVAELMEVEEMDTMNMDESNTTVKQADGNGIGWESGTGGLHQWQQQQHCLIPQLPESPSTPVAWFR